MSVRRVGRTPPPPALERRGMARCVHAQPHARIAVPDAAQRLHLLFGPDLLRALSAPARAKEAS